MTSGYPLLNMIVVLVSIWATMIVPFSVLVAWISDQSPLPYLLPSLLLAPICLLVGKWSVHLTKSQSWFWLMQLFGVGCIVLSCTAFGGMLTFFLPYRIAALIVFFLAICLIWRAVANANKIEDVYLEVTSPLLSTPVKIVQLSDVHIGSRDGRFLRKVIHQTIQHDPDLVVITGDLVDRDSVSATDLNALRLLRCPVYMSTGNHEFDIDIERCLKHIRDQGVIVLRDASERVGEIEILGIDDRKRGIQIQPVLRQLEPSALCFTLLLYHRPDGWESAIDHSVDLMLAGHTHRGQIWPFSVLVRVYYRQLVGYFAEAEKHLYVSTGTGTWGPMMRLGSVNELTVITLRPESQC